MEGGTRGKMMEPDGVRLTALKAAALALALAGGARLFYLFHAEGA
jgi:hypothetical protein